MSDCPRVAIVGGGLAGLTTALLSASAGFQTTLYEQTARLEGSETLGAPHGRALTPDPSMLWLHGTALRTLVRLGIDVHGEAVRLSAFRFLLDGSVTQAPCGAGPQEPAALREEAAALERTGVLNALTEAGDGGLRSMAFRQWMSRLSLPDRTRDVLTTLGRLAMHSAEPQGHAADAAVSQLARVGGGLLYLDGGWTRLIHGIAAAAARHGVAVVHDRILRVRHDDGVVQGVESVSAGHVEHDAVVLAPGGPREVGQLVSGHPRRLLEEHARAVTPVHTATLGVRLSRIAGEPSVVIGADAPMTVFARPAATGPGFDGTIVHAVHYLKPGQRGGSHALARLEGFMDRAVPGWASSVRQRRYWPKVTVSHDFPAPGGGLDARPTVRLPGIGRAYLVGDWVGPRGLLCDAVAASALQARDALLADFGMPRDPSAAPGRRRPDRSPA